MLFFIVRRICECFSRLGGGFALPHKPNLSLPLGEMSRSDREGWNPLYSFSGLPDTNLPAFCPLSHLLCKCQLSQGESREGGAGCTPDASSELLRRLVRVLLLPSRLTPCHLPQGGRLWVSAQRQRWLILCHASGCLAVSPTSQNTVRNTAAMSAESVMPL